ncbi:hypothetical protein HMPREF1613_02006 [Escherichia coli 908616]|nr:hypothetical protein HMPREF9552_04677 [Escherichia coli MS 198-1]EFJ79409.1 hypothetical protein HMPREF9534_04632 [Escherichia coli MS 69-1]ESA79322.1 hypothetical protein HMPREF1588_00432 [Escherichia coli 110957]ESA86896.1 hypothetical protein HMPREF1599_03290 [Escherichia coli 907713]ESD26901.1 hypothetical protein HMPREF1600_02326 [Escherichia coli 907715]ESD56986.1 hypothetical protein HMPREF1605_01274 [Escherichia coli 908521]ESD59931.1 hypothetical protein HMPREF1606_01419 [Escheric
MIGTSRQDGFMHYRNVVCLLACSLFLSSAWGCRLDERNIIFTRNREKAWCICALMKRPIFRYIETLLFR